MLKGSSLNLLDVFQPYKIPYQLLNDQADGHRFQQKCLGVACIHIGNVTVPRCTFFEIIESAEISDASPEQEECTFHSDESSSLDGLASFALTKSLPPKKRRRRRMLRYDLVFTVDKKADHITSLGTYYSFPREALTECLTTSTPHKLILSFLPVHLKNLQCACVLEEGHFKTKLEEFAAVCSHSCKLTDQSVNEKRIQNILISNVSFELLQAIKQTSNVYEIMCQNMMELVKLHHEKVTHHKSEIASETTNFSQSEDDIQMHNWSSDEQAKGDFEEEEEERQVKVKPPAKSHVSNSGSTKKCLYCGSKSTPMWRRGPQGAGTLCNACGVKWKHGKILNGVEPVANTTTTRRNSKTEKKRKRSNADQVTSKHGKRKRNTNNDEFAVPAPPIQQPTWDTTSSSTSESPLESFTSSPNASPMDKRDINSFISYNTETLSIYAGEDAVEAAALLTLLKRS